MTCTNLRRIAVPMLIAVSGVASAHTGHDAAAGDFFTGLAHPFSGLDHMLAMVAVGLWAAAALPMGRRWAAPAVFVGTMTAGAMFAGLGLSLASGGSLELLIAASVLAMGALLAFAPRVAPAAGLALTAVAGGLHGAAHGLEMSAGAGFVAYAAGFVLATAMLHGAGLGAGAWMTRVRASALRHVGVLIGLSGVVLLAARV